MNERIKMGDNPMDIVIKMSEGNPGAMNALMQLTSTFDTALILTLDTLGIYGTDIYVLYSDICNRDIMKMVTVIRSVQLGLFDGEILKDACNRQDYSGRKMVPVEELYLKLKEETEKIYKTN